MSTPDPRPATPRRAWGRIALICALILSLFGNAVALGAWVRLREVRSDLLGSEAASTRLPEDLRQELRSALRSEIRSLRPFLQDLIQSRSAIVSAAKARPFVRAEAEAAMDEFRDDANALLIEVQRIFLDHLEKTAKDGP
jgi:uncharacterized membrane protein